MAAVLQAGTAGLQGLRILIVDDEEDFATTLAGRLELRGMLVESAFSAKRALEMLNTALPDLLLLDMRMPGMSGVDMLHALKRDKVIPGAEAIPVIIVSGHSSEQDFAKAEALGIQGFVDKPVQLDELLAAIRQVQLGKY